MAYIQGMHKNIYQWGLRADTGWSPARLRIGPQHAYQLRGGTPGKLLRRFHQGFVDIEAIANETQKHFAHAQLKGCNQMSNNVSDSPFRTEARSMPLPLIEVLQDGNKLVTLVRYHVPNVHRHLPGHTLTLPTKTPLHDSVLYRREPENWP